jgi:hypothetical protein
MNPNATLNGGGAGASLTSDANGIDATFKVTRNFHVMNAAGTLELFCFATNTATCPVGSPVIDGTNFTVTNLNATTANVTTLNANGNLVMSNYTHQFYMSDVNTNRIDSTGSGFGRILNGSKTTIQSPTIALDVSGVDRCTVTAQGMSCINPPAATGSNSVSGCSLTAGAGGTWAGKFVSGTTGTCTVTITLGTTATNGFSCWANDLTTPADIIKQTATTTTTATIAGTTASGDVLNWGCIAY